MRATTQVSKAQAEEKPSLSALHHSGWWARLDSNQEPTDYESAALTVELRAPRFPYLTHSPHKEWRGHPRPRKLADACKAGYHGHTSPMAASSYDGARNIYRMKKLRFLLSLTNDDNDYQIEQTSAAQQAARKLGVGLDIVYARNDGIVQSQQLLSSIQSTSAQRPDAIIFEPAGSTAHPQIARAAATAGIGVVLLNRDADYIPGPTESSAAKQRYTGLLETKSDRVQLRVLKAHWTEASAYKTVSSFLRLSTSRQVQIEALCAQDDSMAMGARKAFEECRELREQWQKMPFLGCDGLPKTGQEWVRGNLLTATIFIPPNADQAIEMMVKSISSGGLPPERTFTTAKSFPTVEVLKQQSSARARAASR